MILKKGQEALFTQSHFQRILRLAGIGQVFQDKRSLLNDASNTESIIRKEGGDYFHPPAQVL